MNERLFFLTYKLPSLFIGTLIIITSLFLLLFIQGCIKATGTQAQGTSTSAKVASPYFSSNPNAIAAGTEEAMHVIGRDLDRALEVAGAGLRYAASSIIHGLTVALDSVQSVTRTIARSIGSGIMAVMRTTASAIVFVLQIPINLFGYISETRAVSAIIEPADHNPVPIIDPNDPKLLAAQLALPAITPASQSTEQPVQEAIWPMSGQITTHFGEEGRFYRTTHAGIDISDGKPSGVTPIKAFRRGKVIAAGRDGGLGNRVIVDHGSDIVSVYGHLSSISVQVGQEVDTSTTLGFQGSTGVSTGPHLHFEIRVNGQAADPRRFITGHP